MIHIRAFVNSMGLRQLGIIETIRFNRRAIETIGFNRFNRNFKRELTTEKVHHAKSQTWSS